MQVLKLFILIIAVLLTFTSVGAVKGSNAVYTPIAYQNIKLRFAGLTYSPQNNTYVVSVRMDGDRQVHAIQIGVFDSNDGTELSSYIYQVDPFSTMELEVPIGAERLSYGGRYFLQLSAFNGDGKVIVNEKGEAILDIYTFLYEPPLTVQVFNVSLNWRTRELDVSVLTNKRDVNDFNIEAQLYNEGSGYGEKITYILSRGDQLFFSVPDSMVEEPNTSYKIRLDISGFGEYIAIEAPVDEVIPAPPISIVPAFTERLIKLLPYLFFSLLFLFIVGFVARSALWSKYNQVVLFVKYKISSFSEKSNVEKKFTPQLEANFLDVVPSNLHFSAKKLADLIGRITNDEMTTEEIKQQIVQNEDLQAVISVLAGQNFKITNSIISFGENSQLGDVQIRDVAGGNIINLTINMGQKPLD